MSLFHVPPQVHALEVCIMLDLSESWKLFSQLYKLNFSSSSLLNLLQYFLQIFPWICPRVKSVCVGFLPIFPQNYFRSRFFTSIFFDWRIRNTSMHTALPVSSEKQVTMCRLYVYKVRNYMKKYEGHLLTICWKLNIVGKKNSIVWRKLVHHVTPNPYVMENRFHLARFQNFAISSLNIFLMVGLSSIIVPRSMHSQIEEIDLFFCCFFEVKKSKDIFLINYL